MQNTLFHGATLVAVAFAAGCSSSVEPVSGNPQDSAIVSADDGREASTDDASIDPDAVSDASSAPYPAGPYGTARGSVFPDLEWDGYRDAAGDWTKIHMHDYYDPDGSRGIKGLLLDISSGDAIGYCGWCEEWSTNLGRWDAHVRARGGRLLDVLIGTPDAIAAPKYPTVQSLADNWIHKTGIHYDVAADPKLATMDPTGKLVSAGVPHLVVIDPRTMKVAAHVLGLDGGVRYPCTTSDDCCKVGGSRPGIDRQGSSGTGDPFCDVDYVCSAEYASTCVHPDKHSPVPELEKVLQANGAPAPL